MLLPSFQITPVVLKMNQNQNMIAANQQRHSIPQKNHSVNSPLISSNTLNSSHSNAVPLEARLKDSFDVSFKMYHLFEYGFIHRN